jgi:hypothetical protein
MNDLRYVMCYTAETLVSSSFLWAAGTSLNGVLTLKSRKGPLPQSRTEITTQSGLDVSLPILNARVFTIMLRSTSEGLDVVGTPAHGTTHDQVAGGQLKASSKRQCRSAYDVKMVDTKQLTTYRSGEEEREVVNKYVPCYDFARGDVAD